MMKVFWLLVPILLNASHSMAAWQNDTLLVPLGGNSFLSAAATGGQEEVTDSGWVNWTNADAVFSIFVYLNHAGTLKLRVPHLQAAGPVKWRCSIAGLTREISIPANTKSIYLGNWSVSSAGYVKIEFQGLQHSGSGYGRFSQLCLWGTAVDSQACYVKNNDDQFFYWGRRGPSVHLNYKIPEKADSVEWFYSEIMVPEGNDVLGSYFMADGFAEGYFGMQVNSDTERRILFSVWSPFASNDPASIPDDQKIRLLQKGDRVHAGEFGHEGSGGQSFLPFSWKSGVSYGFLLRARPMPDSCTAFTAWFFDPAQGHWQLIAAFNRPHTQTRLTRLHSFLENFIPETGYISRKAIYQHQWVKTVSGKWWPLESAKFSFDATARKRYRLDYQGGSEGQGFFLRNDGFFDQPTAFGWQLSRKAFGQAPDIPPLPVE